MGFGRFDGRRPGPLYGATVGVAPDATWIGGRDGDTIIGQPWVELHVTVTEP